MRRRIIHRPFKGRVAYEWQIGPFVFMWFHDRQARKNREPRIRYWNEYLRAWLWELSLGRFLVWNDPMWRA